MDSVIDMKKINSTCRVCLTDDKSGFSMFDVQDNIIYSNLIKEYTGFTMIQSEDLPSIICDECGSELMIVVKFISNCRLSHTTLERVASSKCIHLNEDSSLVKDEDINISINDLKVNVKNEELDIHYENFSSLDCYNDNTEYFSDDGVEFERNESTYVNVNEIKEVKICLLKDETFLKKKIKSKLKCMDHDDKVVRSESNITDHRRVHKKEGLFKCNFCSKSFSHKSSMTKHRSLKHGKDKLKSKENKFVCDICGRLCKRKYYLKIHLRTHSDEKLFKCNICLKSFTQSGSLSHHKKIHTGERPFKCTVCSKAFISNKYLKKHMIVHTDEKKFKCHICQVALKSKFGLALHLKNIHISEKSFLCDICGNAYSIKGLLAIHLKTKHSGLSGLCQLCKKTFLNLPKHMKDHCGERKFLCNICPKTFSRKMGLNVHLSVHKNQNKFPCTFETCKEAFFQSNQLKFHINKVHHKIHTHVCKFCSRGFFRKSDLGNHISQKFCKKFFAKNE